MNRGELMLKREQCCRRLHGFQFYADNKNLSSTDRYLAIIMVEQEQENLDDLRLLLKRMGSAK
jgi:hypothetical protein